jgi:DnaD/phage-associated family protein
MARGRVGTGRPSGTALGDPEHFAGFPDEGLTTVVPNVFFSRVLPKIERAEEFIVSLYLFYLHGRARGWPRAFSERQLAADAGLMRALSHLSGLPPEGALTAGLSWAEAHGTLLRVTVERNGQPVNTYLINFPASKQAIDRLQTAALPLEETLPPAAPADPPNIFALYEENIGAMTPLIADDLKDAEERYPPQWIEAAFREAVSLNKRNWRYVHSILKRWEAEGPDYEEAGRDPETDWFERRYARGKRGVSRRR